MSEKGFTLVEVLVALVVGSLLLGSISWVLGGLSDDLRGTESQSNVLQNVQTSQLLENILSDARFSSADGESMQRSATNLAFRMTAPMALERRGYIDAELSVHAGQDGKSLALHWPDQDLEEISLLSGMDDIELQYDAKNAAFLNKITIIYLEQGADENRQLILRPKINAKGACIFDPISQRCRT